MKNALPDPMEHRMDPENKFDIPVTFRNASCRDPSEEIIEMQQTELESTAAERYHLESELKEIQSGEWFEWYLNENTVPCGTHGKVYCLPCFQAEIKDLKAAILELRNHEADLCQLYAPPADPQVTTTPADLQPRSFATASARRALELYR